MDQPITWTYTVPLSPEPSSVARARDFVYDHLLLHALPALVDDVRLVVSELATNALQHGRMPYSLTLTRQGHALLVSMHDGSPALPRLLSPDTSRSCGRGLAIVDQLSASWGVDVAADRTKAVWARFDTGRTMAPQW